MKGYLEFMRSIKKEGIEKAAEFLKDIYKFDYDSSQVGIDLNLAAKKLGEHIKKNVVILEVDFNDLDLPLSTSGFTTTIDDTTIVIAINEIEPPYRKRFTIAHELGHIYMGDLSDENSVIYRNGVDSDNKDSFRRLLKEKRADAFASEILMPTSQVIRVFEKNNYSINETAKAFGVSTQAMLIKINDNDR